MKIVQLMAHQVMEGFQVIVCKLSVPKIQKYQ